MEIKPYIQALFASKGIDVLTGKKKVFEDFIGDKTNIDAVECILKSQELLIMNWKIKNRVDDIISQHIKIPNATVGKPFCAEINFKKLGLHDLAFKQFEGLNEIGLAFNENKNSIEGIPTQSGELKIKFLFRIEGEPENAILNTKSIVIVINHDPKTLWKDIPSNKNDIFPKEDDVATTGKLGDKQIVVASKRGRSHENVGSFRDDDFAFKHFDKTGWSVVVVADGAGSAPLARKGSHLACNAIIEYFEQHVEPEKTLEFETKILEFESSRNEVLLKEIEVLAKKNLYKATVFVHNKIKQCAEETYNSHPELFNNPRAKSQLEYFHSTLIFALFKRYDFGFVVLTFGVGDCPIAIMNKQKTDTTLLNWLDVGEFGGGTRFITQPEIFHSKEHPMESRLNFRIISDFSYLFLMTDGIYDPKFVVEANLEKNEKWLDFLKDLGGINDDKNAVLLEPENTEVGTQLSQWMDFWDTGNHDDRTLAIIY